MNRMKLLIFVVETRCIIFGGRACIFICYLDDLRATKR